MLWADGETIHRLSTETVDNSKGLTMTQDDIHKAVEAIMAMRPTSSPRNQEGKFDKHDRSGRLHVHKKMAERQYQKELARIDNDVFLGEK